MGNDMETERFRKLLTELAEQHDAESDPPREPFAPLNATLERQLLRISLDRAAARKTWYDRLRTWVRERPRRRIWIPIMLVPSTAIALLIVQLQLHNPASLQYARAPVAERKLRSGKTEMSRSADGHTLLAGRETEVREQAELRVKRQDTLTLYLPAPPGEKGAIAVRAFLRRDNVLRAWRVTPETRPDGSFLILMPVRILPDLAADQELLFVYGRPDALPGVAELSAGTQSPSQRWHQQSLRLIVED